MAFNERQALFNALKERNKLSGLLEMEPDRSTSGLHNVLKQNVGLRKQALERQLISDPMQLATNREIPNPEINQRPQVNVLNRVLQILSEPKPVRHAFDLAGKVNRRLNEPYTFTVEANSIVQPEMIDVPQVQAAVTPESITTPDPEPNQAPLVDNLPDTLASSGTPEVVTPDMFVNAPDPYWYPKGQVKYGPPAAIPDDLWDATKKASEKTGVPQEILLALSYKETGMVNKNQNESWGLGRGYFQFDLGQRQGLTEEQARDPYWASEKVANEIKSRLSRTNEYTGKPFTLWEAVVAHNVGEGGLYSDQISPYYGIPVKEVARNYGQTLFDYLKDRDWVK